MAETILLVEDDAALRLAFRRLLNAQGHAVVEAGSVPEAEARFAPCHARIVLLDLMLPPTGLVGEGVALCARMLESRPGCKVIVASGAGDTRLALDVVQRGAYDFLTKPVDPDVLLALFGRVAARLALEDRVADLEEGLAASGDAGPLGSSPAIAEAILLAERAAPTDVPILVTGETGTGKDVFARFIHAKSRRRNTAFVAINCGA